MIYEKLSYSDITKSPADIITPYISNEQDSWYKTYGGYHTGVDISANEVYSYAPGVITQIGKDRNGLYTIVIQYSADISFRYTHLKSVYITEGQAINKGEFVGVAKEFVHFEYLTREQEGSMWVVRVGKLSWYKHNPELVLNGGVLLNANDWSLVEYMSTHYDIDCTLSENMEDEFNSSCRGV